jgi:hypothetical protein
MREIDNPTGWRDGLRLRLEDFVDEFVVEGIDHEEVFGAITAEIAGLRAALERDPDPAEEPEDGEAVAEPANDWPAAE